MHICTAGVPSIVTKKESNRSSHSFKSSSASATNRLCAGQCNDAFFRLSKEKDITFLLDTPIALSERGVVCKSGKVLRADIIINASGCKFMARPDFLQSLDLGKIHIVVHRLHLVCSLHALYLFLILMAPSTWCLQL